MRGWLRGALIVAAAAAACKFTPSQATQDAGPKPDAGPCQELGATCADAMTRRACTVVGAMPIDTTCSWGCLGETAHCGVLVPTGSGVTVDDVTDESQLGDVTIDDEDIDGGDGSIMHGGTVLRAPGIGIISGIDFKIVNGYSVFRARNWTITNHDINADGPNPIAIVATRDISIDHLLDVRGSCANGASGPGGFPAVVGGGSDGVGSGGGKGGGNQDSNGGGGGGHGAAGGVGGGALAAAGGTPFGDPLLATLVGGGAGGNGADGVTGLGGGGGGAVQLVANGSISIIGGGNIDASGCGGTHGGDGGNGNDSGGGGGAGGAILLEAHDLAIAGTLTVNGGGGGAGGGGMSGSRGTQNRTPAQGGTGGQGSGGSGAAGSATTGFTGVTGTHSGGGGGGVGIMRLNSWSGSATVDPTKLSPNFDDPQTTTSQGSAHVQ